MIDTRKPRAPGQYDPDVVSDETGTDLSGFKDLAVQEFAADGDINVIMKRFGAYKELPIVAGRQAQYGDFSEVRDFHSAMNQLVQVQERFQALPAEMRAKFRNDPGEMWDFVNDPANADKAVEYGLIPKGEVIKPVVVESAVESASGSTGEK